jgi:cytoskeleton protein RodZ
VEEVCYQIGTRLREAREAADLEVDDVVFRTRIPRSVVEALETEDFSVFTSPTYAKSFLRQYSEFLGVDAEPWLNALEPASYVSGEAWQPMFSGGEASLPAAKRPVRDPRDKENQLESDRGQWSSAWLMVLTVGLIFGAVKGYHLLEEKFGGEPPEIEEQASEPAADGMPEGMPGKAPQLAKAPAPAPPEEVAVPAEQPAEDTHVGLAKDLPGGAPPRAVIVRD